MDELRRQVNRPYTQRARQMATAALASLAAALMAACGGGGTEAGAVADTAVQTSAATAAASSSADTAAAADGGIAFALGKKTTPSPAVKTVAQPANTEGRLLASNCFQCHGTLGTGGFDSIRGKEASEVQEFMTKTASKNIMAAHAQGYTPAQLQKIIAYLQQ